jgi:PEP-CTERM/exosortase A-associated glycosyltransferase
MRRLERRLQEVAEQVKPDILHAHSPALNAIPALRVGRALGIPVVYEVRAFWEDAAVDHGTTTAASVRYRLTRRLETFALRRADHVFAICDGLRRDIVERGIAQSKVSIIPNAVDIDAFEVGRTADPNLREQLRLQGCRVIGFIGSFYAYEGLDLLLDALPRLLATCPDIRILLVGGGPQEAELTSRASRLGVADQVVFAGRIPNREIARYYELVDVLAYPRRSMRLTDLVTPLKPLEAMAQGRLLIASDVGGHRELISDGMTGMLFRAGSVESLAEVLLRLLADPDRWPQLRAAGRAYVEAERNWRSSVARYAPVYDRVVSAAPRPCSDSTGDREMKPNQAP